MSAGTHEQGGALDVTGWTPPVHRSPNPTTPPGRKIRKRFRKAWRANRRWHYVSARGDSGYLYSRDECRDVAERFAGMDVEVAFFKLKPKKWKP